MLIFFKFTKKHAMKKNLKQWISLACSILALSSCDSTDDHAVPSSIAVHNFIWKGMNLYYYWQDEQPLLADNRFANQSELNAFLETLSPADLFATLKMPTETDRFSVLYNDYNVLENALSGQSLNHGAEYGMYRLNPNSDVVYGAIRYIIPNSNAAQTTLQRGAIFYAIDGTPLTVSNYQSLLRSTNLTLQLADWDGNNLIPNGQSVTLTKTALQENPVHTRKVVQVGNHRVGYLLYNGFWTAYDQRLNEAMSYFRSQNIDELVLDLRYNGGGTLTSAQYLASMLTGPFNGQIFAVQDWNAKLNDYIDSSSLDRYVHFTNQLGNGQAIHHLQLSKVYVLTTASTASASELVINGLAPYIDVIQIGGKTAGKNVGSTTLYDSPTYRKQGVNPNHRYAMQPIVFKIANAQGFSDYTNGLTPTIELVENTQNMGTLGETDEPLFARALQHIQSGFRTSEPSPGSTELDNSQNLRNLGGLVSEIE